jgi:hypothetical protein
LAELAELISDLPLYKELDHAAGRVSIRATEVARLKGLVNEVAELGEKKEKAGETPALPGGLASPICLQGETSLVGLVLQVRPPGSAGVPPAFLYVFFHQRRGIVQASHEIKGVNLAHSTMGSPDRFGIDGPVSQRQLWIMVAGPYSAGARSEAERVENLRALNRVAYEVLRRGHVPIIGVNLALPIIEAAGAETYDQIMMPLSLAAAERCDAVLRIGGPSTGADQEVERIRARGGAVYRSIAELPQYSSS